MSRYGRVLVRSALAATLALVLSAVGAAPAALAVDDPPVRTIGGASTGLSIMTGMAVSSSGELYISDRGTNSIRVFAAGASGDVAPIRVIAGASTRLNYPYDLAFDRYGQLHVANFDGGEVLTFAPGAGGDVAPIASLGSFIGPSGVTFDAAGNLFVTTRDGSVQEFAAGSTGSAPPMRTISGSATRLDGPLDIEVNTAGEIVVADYIINAVLVYAAGASGNVAPIRSLDGSAIFLISGNFEMTPSGDLLVPDYTSHSVRRYPPVWSGTATPTDQLSGPATTYNDPYLIALHGAEMFVGNFAGNTITVHALSSLGVAPVPIEPVLPLPVPAATPMLAATGVDALAGSALALALLGAAVLLLRRRRVVAGAR